MHTAEEIGVDDFQASRAPDDRYRTSPLKGLWTHTKGGFYHDGRFVSLLDVVNHYDTFKSLHLSDQDKSESGRIFEVSVVALSQKYVGSGM